MTSPIEVDLYGGPQDGAVAVIRADKPSELPTHLPGNTGYVFAQPAGSPRPSQRKRWQYRWTYLHTGRRGVCGCHPAGCSPGCPNRIRRAST